MVEHLPLSRVVVGSIWRTREKQFVFVYACRRAGIEWRRVILASANKIASQWSTKLSKKVLVEPIDTLMKDNSQSCTQYRQPPKYIMWGRFLELPDAPWSRRSFSWSYA